MSKRPATGRLVLVEMDPRSLEEIGVWPWPRSIHARIIDRLMAAGVSEIGYDVDFSSRSTPEQDRALAAAIARASGKIILPAFQQRSSAQGADLHTHDTQPLADFMKSAQLGNVVFRPSVDGLIRGMSVVVPWKDGDVPAMSALLAGPAAFTQGGFLLDFGIDINSVPRYALVDVLEGRVPPSALKGKKVLVGAAATELGDQHAVPVYGRLHGIELQALAFESLVQGRALHSPRPEAIIIGLLLISLMVGNRLELLRWQTSAAIGGAAAGGFIAFVLLLQILMPIIVPPTAVVLLVASFILFSAYRDLWANAILIFRQRMNLMHQRAFIEEVMENSFDGLVVTNSYGEIVVHNDAARALLRAGDEPLERRALNEFLPANKEFLFPGKSEKKKDSQDDKRQPIVVRFNPHGEPEYYLEFMPGTFSRQTARKAPEELRTTDRVFYTYNFRDVTQRVKREISDRLERDRALEQNRAKSEVLASMSHELRTPLNAILGFSEIMKNEMLGPLTKAYLGYADGVHESGRHLLSLIDEMLDMARIDVGEFTMEEALFDIGQTLKGVMRIAEGWQDTRNRFVTVEIAEDLPQMMGSARLIKQCIINILANAIKYSNDGDSVTIKVDLNSKGDLAIEVSDTGVGIEEDQIEFITKPFYRAGGVNTRGPEGGVGLGLSLVDSYVRSHGGRLEIFSKPGLGTNLRMIFPAARLFTAETPALSTPHGEEDSRRDEEKPDRPKNVIDFRNKK